MITFTLQRVFRLQCSAQGHFTSLPHCNTHRGRVGRRSKACATLGPLNFEKVVIGKRREYNQIFITKNKIIFENYPCILNNLGRSLKVVLNEFKVSLQENAAVLDKNPDDGHTTIKQQFSN
jgi:hypothetical protein